MRAGRSGRRRETADASGNLQGQVLYYPFGDTRVVNGSTATTFRYTGQRQQTEIGLYFYGARWYDPVIGRFTAADTIVPEAGNSQAFNRFSYASNNPTKYIDPTGHCWGVASGLRNTGAYGATCNNIDMALTIVESPNASAGEKVLAGGYVLIEGVAHVAFAFGSAGLACAATGPGCVAAVEGALGIGTAACADGDCGNEIQVSQQVGQNIWQMGNARGLAIEEALGGNLPPGFKTFDRFVNGVATSIKSLDLSAKSYQTAGAIWSRVEGYVNAIINFNQYSRNGVSIDSTSIVARELLLAIPPNATQAQLAVLQQLQAWAAQSGVILTIVVAN